MLSKQAPPDPVSTWEVMSSIAAVVGVGAAVATLGVAIAAAVFALRQLKQASELAEDQARPYVIASLVEDEAVWWFSDFVVKNIGQTAARDLTVEFSRPWLRPGDPDDERFMDTRFLNEVTSVLPPGAELRTSFVMSTDLIDLAEQDPEPFAPITVTLRYQDRLRAEIVEQFVIDPLSLKGTVRTDIHGLHHIASTLRAWAKKSGVNSF